VTARRVVRGAAAAAAALASGTLAAQTPAEHANAAVTRQYETVKLADGVYAFIAPETFGSYVGGNSMAVIGDSAVLVFDSGAFPALTRRMIADIRKLTDRPVRWVVNSHWHPDHWLGNAEYRAAFPNVAIVSTADTRDHIVRQGAGFVQERLDSASLQAFFRTALATGKLPNGTPLTEAQRHYGIATIPLARAAYPAWQGARVELPNVTFEQSLRVQLGGAREVRVMFLGRGNTAGDAVAFVPDARVLATGDLVVAPVPYSYGSYLGEWIETLGKLTALAPAAIVPGHGPVQRNTAYIALVSQALTAARTQVAAAARRGLSLDSTRVLVRLDGFRDRFAGTSQTRRDSFEQDFLGGAVQRAYEEWKFQQTPTP